MRNRLAGSRRSASRHCAMASSITFRFFSITVIVVVSSVDRRAATIARSRLISASNVASAVGLLLASETAGGTVEGWSGGTLSGVVGVAALAGGGAERSAVVADDTVADAGGATTVDFVTSRVTVAVMATSPAAARPTQMGVRRRRWTDRYTVPPFHRSTVPPLGVISTTGVSIRAAIPDH